MRALIYARSTVNGTVMKYQYEEDSDVHLTYNVTFAVDTDHI
jgi:hypothetical protein